MRVTSHSLHPPSPNNVVSAILPALRANFAEATVSLTSCPDLRQAPFHLAARGLGGHECTADIGGQPNLFPEPKLDAKFSLIDIAKSMDLSPNRGFLLGAGAGPFHVLGLNSELAPNLSWQDGYDNVTNLTHYTKYDSAASKGNNPVVCEKSPSTDCALMMNLYGSEGLSGDVIKITARTRTGKQNFTDTIRFALHDACGDDRPVSMGGVFLINKGKANFHVMPDFPSKDQLPFKDRDQLNDWLTYHNFDAPIVCLTVFHSADPGKKLGLRMEHTHCFTTDGSGRGGHYHYDLKEDGIEDVEYIAYLNVAKTIYRIEKPEVTLERDLHD